MIADSSFSGRPLFMSRMASTEKNKASEESLSAGHDNSTGKCVGSRTEESTRSFTGTTVKRGGNGIIGVTGRGTG